MLDGHCAAAQLAATKTGGNVDAIFQELTENLVANGHMVPAGIVAESRPERGYSFVYVVWFRMGESEVDAD